MSKLCVLCLALLSSPLDCTTIVMRVTQQRIILAADTRRRVLTPSLGTNASQNFKDDLCKVVALKRVAFGSMGESSYEPVVLGDTVKKWDASDDARTVYEAHVNDIRGMADAWGKLPFNTMPVSTLLLRHESKSLPQ